VCGLFEETAIHRDRIVRPSERQENFILAITLPFPKISLYTIHVATYNNTDKAMPNSYGQMTFTDFLRVFVLRFCQLFVVLLNNYLNQI